MGTRTDDDDEPSPAADDHPAVGPPSYILLLALVSVALSMVLLFEHGLAFHVAGYLLASVVPIMAVGLFRRVDLQQRINPYYVQRAVMNQIIPIVLVLGLLAAILHAWSIATELAS